MFAWAEFLEGGGRPVLALAFGTLAIVSGQPLARTLAATARLNDAHA
jgi:hypothetical protein